MSRPHRRTPAIAMAMFATTLILAGCSGGTSAASGSGTGSGAEEPTEKVTIRFTWWGNEARAEATLAVIEAFEKEHPNITVTPEYSDFGAYWDRIAVDVAGDHAADLITMSGAYPAEYADKGALLDLGEVSDIIDTSDFDETALDLGKIDGTQYSITSGLNSMAMAVDPAVFEAAGVELPDDETWTWDDYAQIAADISAGSPDGAVGSSPMPNDSFLAIWARQHGEPLYAEDGSEVSASKETLTEFFELNKELLDNGGFPDADSIVEDANAAAPEQTLLGLGKQGMKLSWSNQLAAYGTPGLELLKLPGETPTPGAWLRSSMDYAISSTSQHPKEAAMLLDFLVNSEEAASHILSDRGIPANKRIREFITPELDETQLKEIAYLDRLAEVGTPAPLPFPPGSAATLEILQRHLDDLFFGRRSPEELAESLITEVNGSLG